MTEGRKSRWVTRALFSAFAALAVIAAVPALAAATPAEDEYDLNLPEADGQSNDPATQSAEGSSSPSPEPTPSATEAPATDDDGSTAGGGVAGSGGGGDGGAAAGGGGDDKPAKSERSEAFPTGEQPVTDLAADDSGGGGISMPLILLAVAAAACAGIAFWRLRRSKGDGEDTGHEAGARPPGDVARGTQSS
jgi:hypothetical protein